MCYEKEIPSLGHSDTTVDDCARLDIAITLSICSLLVRRIQAIMMILAHNNEGDLGLGCILEDLCASSSYCRYFLTQHNLVLAFGHAYLISAERP